MFCSAINSSVHTDGFLGVHVHKTFHKWGIVVTMVARKNKRDAKETHKSAFTEKVFRTTILSVFDFFKQF